MSDIVISISSIAAHVLVHDAVVSCMVQVCLLMLFVKWSPTNVSERVIIACISCVGMMPVLMAMPSSNCVPMSAIAGCMIHAAIHHVQEALRKKNDDSDVINL